MPGNWWSHAAGRNSWGRARLRRTMALALCCAGVIGLLAAMEVTPAAAQTIDCAQSSAALIRDCETLLGLKDTLDPDGVLNWAGNVALSSWEGVGSDNAYGVTRLSITSNRNLTGTIPTALGDLTSLVELDLHNNELSGRIPAALGDLSNLTDLDLSHNRLSGSIPAALGDLAALDELDLNYNELSGSIPTALGDLSNLTDLELAGNRLSGSIPAALGDLTALRDLYLHNNGLSGSIPTALGDLTALDRLDLSSNELSGSIPGELGNLTDLRALRLDKNRLSGSIPAALGNLSSLRHLRLNDNRLSGSIPAELGNLAALMDLVLNNNQLSSIATGFADAGDLANLQILWLEYNQLSGSIPAELGNLTRLDVLRLDNNKLSGSIPAELGNLTALEYLGLQHNQLSSITAGFADAGDLPNLETLHLHRNKLTGSIPAELGNLAALLVLDLACNQLTGSIPSSLANISTLQELYLNGNTISSEIPTGLERDGLTINVSPYCWPTAPRDVRVRPGDRELTVTWAAPADNGGGVITAYDVRYRSFSPHGWNDVPDVWSTGDGALKYTITGLTNGTEYWVQVQARNAAGGNPWSSTITDNSWSASVTGTPGSGGGGGGGSDGGSGGGGGGSSSGGGSRAPAPPRSPIIGRTSAATAKEVAGNLLVLQRHDEPGVENYVGVGWISRDGHPIIVIGFVRDGDLGQTYAVVRREGDGQVVRRWIAPDSPLVYAVPWASVNTEYTFPVGVILAIPLDDQYPWPNMLTRRFDGGDDRILAYDAELGQWRHVPDLATFQARGYYWCNVTAADAGFFDRITLGPPYPASNVPARADYPVCQT